MRARGFTYVGLLLAVALAGAALAAAGMLWSTAAKRDREAELLFIGDQFRRAITSYYTVVPAGQRVRFPEKFDDLISDNRWPVTKRHLRKLFFDPMTVSREWGIVRAPDGGIMGVHSLSEEPPLKRAGFNQIYAGFAQAANYRDWRFVYVPIRRSNAPGLGAGGEAKPGAPDEAEVN